MRGGEGGGGVGGVVLEGSAGGFPGEVGVRPAVSIE